MLLGVASLLTISALLAIGILLAGHFGRTQGRILGSTALLAAYGLVALPAAFLLDQGRCRRFALAAAALAAVAAALALAAIWSGSETLAESLGSVTAFALAGAQASALAARRREMDPAVVRRLFAASSGTALVAAAAFAAFIWTQPNGNLFPRLFGSLVVFDLLLVALQPILARTRPAAPARHLRVVLATGETLETVTEGGDLAAATAKAIRRLERSGERVARIEIDSPG